MADTKRRQFLAVLLTGSFCLLTALSLVPTGSRHNLLGPAGALVGSFLYYGFGLWAWLFPFLFLRLTLHRLRKEPLVEPGFKILGLILALLSFCSITRVLWPGRQMLDGVEWGGWIGIHMGDWLIGVFSPVGSVVVGVLVLILAAWLLEKEEHLLTAAKSTVNGLSRGGNWFREHGFEALATLQERLSAALQAWKDRRQEKKIGEEGRRKLGVEKAPERPSEKPALSRPAPATVLSPAPVSRVEKPSVRSRPLFTGEAEETPVPPMPGPAEDVVSAALAEAKGTGPEAMSLKQKMEAASIEMAEEEPEEEKKPARVVRSWQLPAVHILKTVEDPNDKMVADFEGVSRTLKETLTNFGVEATVVGVNPGPTVTQYEVQPAAGVKITRIASLADDLALALKCGQVRVVAPIPGKATVGIEVPNAQGRLVTFKELISQEEFLASKKKLGVALGKDIAGATFIASLKEMPHVLIAGSTGSGKSVCVNTLIASLIFKYTPEEMRLVLVDPKRVEMTIYQGLPHLALPVMNDSKQAHLALKWLVREMEERYEQLAHIGARDIDSYNAKVAQKREAGDTDIYPMYYIVVLVDELADLMMVAKDQVEESITRLAQMARAVGIHLCLATQRPSVEVITGIIKANFPSRIAFQVASKVDSRTILDMNGAEALLGRGDMLYLPPGAPKPLRLQGAYVTLEEIERLVDFWKSQGAPIFSAELNPAKAKDLVTEESEDELYEQAKEIVLRAKQASTSLLQRRLKVGYSRAARLLDDMEMRGVVGPADGNKPRKILVPGGGGQAPLEGGDEEFDENNA
ncbi:MAG TPA: DNA translocase FtsK [bacterium]|nr:DNA translocase FtsK [bacterium]